MQSTALVDLLGALVADTEEETRPTPALIEAFALVPDPRRRQGRRYPLPFLLGALVLALLCNCDTLEAVGQWCAAHRDLLTVHFPAQRFHTPTGSLYRRLLPRLSVAHLEAAVGAWVRGSLDAAADDALALDGKTVRGAGAAEAPAPHLLSVSTHATQETLVQVRVDEKTNEIPVARALLPVLPLAGRAAYFSDPTARVGRATTHDRRRGRTETRTLYVTTALNTHLRRYVAFPHIRQVACLLTATHDRSGTHREVRFLLTSLPPQRATPARLLALARGHWSIESRHFVRDVTFGEDRSALRTGDAPQIMAACRNLVHTLIRRTGTTAIAAARRAFSYHPARALTLLCALP